MEGSCEPFGKRKCLMIMEEGKLERTMRLIGRVLEEKRKEERRKRRRIMSNTI